MRKPKPCCGAISAICPNAGADFRFRAFRFFAVVEGEIERHRHGAAPYVRRFRPFC